MITKITDYNGADQLIRQTYRQEWDELNQALQALPLYLKPSDQADIKGTPIFDPIATNAFIRSRLQRKGWSVNIPIPEKYNFLGTDVDLGKNGVIVEVQFSNYPFLLNNILRAEVFFKAGLEVVSQKTGLVVIITKGHMFPASNSTLYYEQAKNQLDALAEHKVFVVPVRLVGLVAQLGKALSAVWTQYKEARYSRTVKAQKNVRCDIAPGKSEKSRCSITISKGST